MSRPKFPTPRVRLQRALGTAAYLAWLKSIDRPRKSKDMDEGGVPVDPERPRHLTGGGAELLEFED